jgi:sialate O-acetylesterase
MKNALLCFLVSLLFLQTAEAQVRLPRILLDSMVLQRNAKVKLWGWAQPGERIQVRFNKKTYKATTGNDGKWAIFLQPTKAGGPYTIQIDASNHITLKDVLFGDVWVCAGQSNMVHQMSLHAVRYADEIARANYPQIRQFWVPNVTNVQGPQEDLPGGSWKAANPKDVLDFSAVAYFFAKSLYEKYGVPIGIINASWGGVPIEAMMSEESLKEFPNILATVEKNKDTAYVNGTNRKAALANRPPAGDDKGVTGAKPWYDPAYNPKGWRPINIPGYWEDQGIKDLDGVVWYRREIDVPVSMTTAQAKVFLGRIVDADALYINGKQVGSTGYMYPQRRYPVPAGLLKPGKNLFVIRVTNNFGKGGFVPDKPYQLIAGSDTLDLKGEWQYKVGQVFTPQRSFAPSIALQNQPASLYNAMIAPITNYTIKGFNWYQGESNAGRPAEYAKLQPAMIRDWRQKWNNPDAPFFFVQLPGFMEMTYLPTESSWAAFREAQAASLSLPNTGMAVAIDLGEWNDIHPDRKKEVGERLALQAMKVAYGEKGLVPSGPLYQSAQREGARIVLSFSHVGGGLITSDGEELSEFSIAGADKKFVWAKAKIEGDKILVWSDDVQAPLYVRYAWADNPVNPNLSNKEGLPASPFQATVNP